MVIFEPNEQAFDTLGLGALCPMEAEVYEGLNGDFTLDLTHPYDSAGKWKRLENERIMLADTPTGPQPFRIYYMKPSMERIEVKARHIFYDLLGNLCQKIDFSGGANGAMQAIKSSMSVSMPFVFDSNMSNTGGIFAENDNPVSVILQEDYRDGETKSFLYSYGGELKRDFFHVSMLQSVGQDRGVWIAYEKNLIGLEVTEDLSDVATRIYPIGKDGLTGGYIDSPYIGSYVYPKIKVIEDSSAETQADLRQLAEDFFAAGGDLPLVNIKVDFIDLSKTEEYKDYAVLEEVFLGDTVTVINQKMGFSKKAKVISYKYDPLRRQYNSIELGDFTPSITSPITQGANAGRRSEVAETRASTAMNTAVNVESRISGVPTLERENLYICLDGDSLAAATKYFRFGKNGLEFTANNGGSWKTVIDANGNVV